MSRVGKIPVKLPHGVKVAISGGVITVEGPKGKLTQDYNPLISFENTGTDVIVKRAYDEKQSKAFHGLYRNLLNNMVLGVSTGWTVALIVNGVGYRAEVQGKLLVMNLGFSNEVYVGIPDGLTVVTESQGRLVVSGNDKQRVGEFAAQIRKLRKPEPYKGKGIRYEKEHIRRKVGKSGVK
jgi:large subunit ribosomal protein L6